MVSFRGAKSLAGSSFLRALVISLLGSDICISQVQARSVELRGGHEGLHLRHAQRGERRQVGLTSLLDRAIGMDDSEHGGVCTISGVQSAIVNGMLYISGGEILYNKSPSPEKTITGPNRNTFWIDLSLEFNSTIYPLQVAKFPDDIPSFTDAAFFPAEDAKIYQYEGSSNKDVNETTPGILVLDTITKTWSAEPQMGDKIAHAEEGSFVSVPQQGLGFWIGGIATSDSSGRLTATVLNQLVRFDTISKEWNVEETGFAGRVRGNTVYVPIGENGMLVNFAGGEVEKDNVAIASLDHVEVYDIASSKWYSQETIGDSNSDTTIATKISTGFPAGRLNPCSVVVDASKSNYHIYMFGGAAAQDESSVILDDIWVLSIPAFEWKSVGKSDVGQWDSRCHLASKSQVILVGGKTSAGQCESRLFKVFDLNKLGFTDTFDPNAGDYRPLISLPGGTTDLEPAVGILQSTVIHTGLARMVPTATLTRSQSEITAANTSAALIVPVSSENTIPITSAIQSPKSSTTIKQTSEISTGKPWSTQSQSQISDSNTKTKVLSSTLSTLTTTPYHTTSISITNLITKPLINTHRSTTTITFKVSTSTRSSNARTTHRTQHSSISPSLESAITSSIASITVTTVSTVSISTTPPEFTNYTPPDLSVPTNTDDSQAASVTTANSPRPTLTPYKNTTGIIAGAIVGSIGLIGGLITIFVIFCYRAKPTSVRRLRRDKRNSGAEDLLATGPQMRSATFLNGDDIPIPPRVEASTRRKSRMDWVRFSKARGLVEVFELGS
ncbi:hypothetical protein TWF694_011549 [Orbilia ellipsospora]|uniref:Galactose oxidase n=1 Tax=Orbilia ellipsospora TaxID=2528407 RepID=A0AAV9X6P6_9PEZI